MILKAAAQSDLQEGEILGVEIGGKKLALYLIAGKVYATDDECSHVGCSFSKDGAVDGLEVECLCHGSRFIIPTGETTAPPAFDPVAVYTVEVQADAVMVDISE